MTYKQRFRQQCADDGFDLGVADALRRLRRGSSDAGWKRLLEQAVSWNQRRTEAQRQREQSGQEGRAA